MSADLWATPERAALRETAAKFTQAEIAPHLAEWEDAGRVPFELHRKAAALGLLGVGFDEAVGGSGGDLIDVTTVTEAMAAAGASSGLLAALFTHGIACPHIVTAGDSELIDAYVRPTLAGERIGSLAVTEPDGGSDVAAIRTRARADGGDLIVDGAKTFITSGIRADFVTAVVRTGGPGHGGISLVVIDTDRPGFTKSGPLRKMGWHCSDTAELSLDDVRVPRSHIVGPPGHGFALLMRHFVSERLSLAAHAYSIAQRSLDLAAAYAAQRQTFGRPLATRQVIRHKLVEMHRRVAVARTYSRSVIERAVSGQDVAADAVLAKKTAVEACDFVVDSAVQIFGGMGYLRESEVERHYRDARILGIGGGATEVLDELAARLLGYGSDSSRADVSPRAEIARPSHPAEAEEQTR
ncbi:MAG TPA: acyl-CoA dehydrogenase family protein [Nocardioidaceae bacterium]|nr:acyl-CoA dehydrogenase family protein [Nocardioidaceae bacterium]